MEVKINKFQQNNIRKAKAYLSKQPKATYEEAKHQIEVIHKQNKK